MKEVKSSKHLMDQRTGDGNDDFKKFADSGKWGALGRDVSGVVAPTNKSPMPAVDRSPTVNAAKKGDGAEKTSELDTLANNKGWGNMSKAKSGGKSGDTF